MEGDRLRPGWRKDWTVGMRVWIERAGRAMVGPGRLELLEGIERHHSISAAARQIGMSYRHAWLLVQNINDAAGEALVVAATGGTRGGGARLTDAGRNAIALFRALQDQMQQSAAQVVQRLVQLPTADTVHVAAASSLEEVLGQLLVDFTLQQPTLRVRGIYGASDELADHVLAGANVDVFLSADRRQLARLQSAGLLVERSRVALAANGLAVAALANWNEKALRKPADLRRAGDAVFALARPGSPTGRCTAAWLQREGLTETVAHRSIHVDNARAVVSAIRAGQAQLGIVCSSDASHLEGCRILFTVERLPMPLEYDGALVCGAKDPAPARQFLRFLISPAARARFRQCGFHLKKA